MRVISAVSEAPWITGFNPFTAEGKKTAALEIWSTVLSRQALERPLAVFVSVGDGNIISGMHKGFKDLQTLGWLEQMPRLYGVQAQGSAAIANAFQAGSEAIVPVSAQTIADSISVDLPRDGVRAVRAAKETGGSYIKVKDGDILKAIAALGKPGFQEAIAALSAISLNGKKRNGQLQTSGPYGFARHPVYGAIVFLLNPALAILLRSWFLILSIIFNEYYSNKLLL